MATALPGQIGWWCPSLDTAGNGTTTLTDLIGARTGTLTNMDAATDWVANTESGGVRALDFDGTNDEVLLASAFFTMPFSVSLWAKPRNATALNNAFSIGSSASNSPLFSIAFRGDVVGDPIYVQMRGANDTSNTFAVGASFAVDQWVHVFAVFRSASYRQIYVNGVAGTEDTTTHTVETLNRMSIGSLARVTSGLFFDGLVDDVRIFNREPFIETIQDLASRRAYQPSVGGGFPLSRVLN